MKAKTSFLERAKRLETSIRVKREVKREIKAHSYQVFLQHRGSYLPSRKKLFRWRRRFIFGATFFIAIVVFQVFFFYSTIWTPPDPLQPGMSPTWEQIWDSFLNVVPGCMGAIFLILFSFGMSIDWVIYRRWGNDFTIFKW